MCSSCPQNTHTSHTLAAAGRAACSARAAAPPGVLLEVPGALCNCTAPRDCRTRCWPAGAAHKRRANKLHVVPLCALDSRAARMFRCFDHGVGCCFNVLQGGKAAVNRPHFGITWRGRFIGRSIAPGRVVPSPRYQQTTPAAGWVPWLREPETLCRHQHIQGPARASRAAFRPQKTPAFMQVVGAAGRPAAAAAGARPTATASSAHRLVPPRRPSAQPGHQTEQHQGQLGAHQQQQAQRQVAAAAARGAAPARQQQFVQVEPDGSDAWRLDSVVEALKEGAVGIIPTGGAAEQRSMRSE